MVRERYVPIEVANPSTTAKKADKRFWGKLARMGYHQIMPTVAALAIPAS